PIADLLEAAAIAAIPLGYDVLLDLSGRGDRDTSEDLAAAVEAQLLERPPTQQEIYQFRHTLTRDAVASAIPESRQTLLHVRVAEALEKLRDDRQSATIARHFAAGDRKSTRLNSSHVSISYAVFCLKKKNHHDNT